MLNIASVAAQPKRFCFFGATVQKGTDTIVHAVDKCCDATSLTALFSEARHATNGEQITLQCSSERISPDSWL